MAEASFEVGGEVYPFATSPRLKDMRLIEKITGIDITEYTERESRARKFMESGVEDKFDPIVMLGMVAMSISQAHPDWDDRRVIKYCDDVRFEDIIAFGGDDADPPVEAADQTPADSSDSSDSSTSSADTSPAQVQG
jgi:hypothetical protein